MLVCEPKFHSWGRCTIAVTNMHSDLKFNPSSGLCINLVIYIILYYVDPLFRILGCKIGINVLSVLNFLIWFAIILEMKKGLTAPN